MLGGFGPRCRARRRAHQKMASGSEPMFQHGNIVKLVLLALGCVLASAPNAAADGPTIAGTGAVSGTVTASKPFTAAQVYLRNAEKGVTFMVYTAGGKYQAVNLYPGDYDVTVARRGFASDPQKIKVQAGASAK